MSPHALETLRKINANLRAALTRLRPEHTHCLMIKPQDFSDLLADLLSGAECLRGLATLTPSTSTAEVERESSEYWKNLRALKQDLPGFQSRLLAEKTRLENAQAHVSTSLAWARTSKKTL